MDDLYNPVIVADTDTDNEDDDMSTKTSTYDPTEYMRKYRAAGKDTATKVQSRAKIKALSWVRSNHPAVWAEFLREARAEFKTGEYTEQSES